MRPEDRVEKKFIYVKYVGRIAVMTGRVREALDVTDVKDVAGVLELLEAAYPGFYAVYHPRNGLFNQNTAIICRRKGAPSFSIVDPREEIRRDDVLTFW